MLPTQTPTVRTTSDAGLNTTENNTNYIIIGVVSGAVVIMFLITMGFALVLVRTHRRHNRRERNKHEQRNGENWGPSSRCLSFFFSFLERRFTDVVESSTKYNSNATLNSGLYLLQFTIMMCTKIVFWFFKRNYRWSLFGCGCDTRTKWREHNSKWGRSCISSANLCYISAVRQ